MQANVLVMNALCRSGRGAGFWLCGGLLVTWLAAGSASANPASFDDTGNLVTNIWAGIALLVEVTVVGPLLVVASGIDQKLHLAGLLIGLNAATYSVFVVWLHRYVHSLTVTETLIWLTETFAVSLMTRHLGERWLTFKQTLPITALGNLVSFIAGFAG